MCDEEGNEWIDKNTYNALYEEKERLNNIINKAIEYIETYKEHFKNYIYTDVEFNVLELERILNEEER